MAEGRTQVWLLNMGGPDRVETVQPFLQRLLSDPDLIQLPLAFVFQPIFAFIISRTRARKVAGAYERMGGASPQLAAVAAQARALEASLGQGFRCVPVFRYWGGSAEDARRSLLPGERVLLLSLYPHACRATTTTSLKDARAALRGHDGAVAEVEHYPTHPLFIQAWKQAIRRAVEGLEGPFEVLFSAHGVPVSLIESGDPYKAEIEATVGAVVEGEGWSWHLCWQSRVGVNKWLEPSTSDTVRRLAPGRTLVMVPIAFTSDHIETLIEIGEELREEAEAAGCKGYVRVPALNDDPAFVATLAALVKEACP